MKVKRFWKENWLSLLLIALTAIGITVTGIVYRQSPFRIWPLYNSLLIMALSAKANRYSCLFGGFNSILYAIVYWNLSLIGSAASAFFFSFPVQLVTFVLYHRRKYGNSTLFRMMPWKWRGVTLLGFAAIWLAAFFVIKASGGSHVGLDTTSSLLGILITFLTMFAFVEAPLLNIVNSIFGILLQVELVRGGAPEQSTYLIYHVYCLICVIMGAIRTIALYREQRALKKGEKTHENGMESQVES